MRVWLFAGGFVAAWTAFSAVAAVLQAALDDAAMLTGAIRVAPLIGSVILALAGAYQLSPLKRGCLRHCQSPIGFLMSHWRDGRIGAIAMGLRHGTYCVGCCWMLMAGCSRGCDEPAVGGSVNGFCADRASDAMG